MRVTNRLSTGMFTLLAFVPSSAFAAPAGIESLVTIVIYLIVLGLIFWLLWWALNAIGLPEPFNKVAHVVVVLAAFITVLYLLLGILPPFPR